LRHLLLDTAQSETPAKFNIVLAARPWLYEIPPFDFLLPLLIMLGVVFFAMIFLSISFAAGLPYCAEFNL
jgi:hypothetical protein